MADEELATRAPESDAQQGGGIPGDTKVEQGAASMGEHCTTDRPTPPGEHPSGEMTSMADVDVYITKPADYPHSPCKLLLLLTGGTGVRSINNQLQADKYAAEGFLVVMPDQFSGEPAPTTTTTTTMPSPSSPDAPSIIEQVKLGVASVAKSFTIDMWLARHTPEKVLPILSRVLTSMREEFADAAANGGGVYAVGYCFGARYVLLLGAETREQVSQKHEPSDRAAEEGGIARQGAQIKCGAIAHGTQIARDDLVGVQVPLYVVAVEDDSLFPDEVREEGTKALKEKGVECEVSVYKGVPHGFAVFGDYEEKAIVEKQGEAFGQMLAWLKAH